MIYVIEGKEKERVLDIDSTEKERKTRRKVLAARLLGSIHFSLIFLNPNPKHVEPINS